MPIKRLAVAALGLLSSAALGQSMATLGQPDTSADKAHPVDVGRPSDRDRGSLSGRGGADAVSTNRTYGGTIGSQISGSIGQPIGSRLGPK